jgi:hypothetical protein
MTYNLSSQEHLNKGDKLLSVYAGFVNPEPFTFSIFSFSGVGNPSPSANINFQYAVSNKITLGPFASYYRVDADYTNSIDQFELLLQSQDFNDIVGGLDCLLLGNCDDLTVIERISVLTIGAKASYTRNIIDALETYISMHLGYSINRRETIAEGILDSVSEELGLGVEVPSFVYFTSVGGRWFLNEKLGFFGEFGFGNSHLLTIGITMRMGY